MRTPPLLRRWAIAAVGAALATSASVTVAAGTAAAADISIGGGSYSGAGIDTCQLGSTQSLDAWKPDYDVMVAYIGGVAAACPADRNWVQHAAETGWNLLPTYVGPQAPYGGDCDDCVTLDPDRARQQGIDAADDAVRIAGEFGIGPGSPLYYDMEYYADRTSEGPVLEFLAGWTETIKANGYRAGVYGDTAIVDLADRYNDPDYPRPDAVWIHWDGADSAYGLPGIPDSYWAGHRTVQYDISGSAETHGGVTAGIDRNFVDGDVAVADGDGGGDTEQPGFGTGTTSTPGETLTVRSGPGTGFGAVTQLPDQTVVEIRCQWTRGTPVTGPWGTTGIWDKITLDDGGAGYISDAWVHTGSNERVAQECGVVPTN